MDYVEKQLSEVQSQEKMLGLARYDKMLTAIAECHRVDEALQIKQTARALEVYAAQARNTEAERQAAEIRMRAERRTGELLRETAKNGQRASRGQAGGRGHRTSPEPTIKNLGISRDQSSRYQKLAEIPEKQFEKLVRQPGTSTDGILRRASPVEVAQTTIHLPGDPFNEQRVLLQLFNNWEKGVEKTWPRNRDLTPVIRKVYAFASYLEGLQRVRTAELRKNVDAIGLHADR
jgi:hypothetical protein